MLSEESGGRSDRAMIPRKDDLVQRRGSGTCQHCQLKINTIPKLKSMPKFDRFSRKVYDTQFIEKRTFLSVHFYRCQRLILLGKILPQEKHKCRTHEQSIKQVIYICMCPYVYMYIFIFSKTILISKCLTSALILTIINHFLAMCLSIYDCIPMLC